MIEFVLLIDHKRQPGWNKHEKEVQAQVQRDLQELLKKCDFEQASVSSILLHLSFSNRSTKLSLEPIYRFEGILKLVPIVEIDWRNEIDADKDQMKKFIWDNSLLALIQVCKILNLPAAALEAELPDADKRLADFTNPTLAEAPREPFKNQLHINIALSNNRLGDEHDAKFAQALCKELASLAEEKSFVIEDTYAGQGYFTIEISVVNPIELGDDLIPWLRMMKLKAGSFIEVAFINGPYIEIKKADISQQAETFERN